MLPQNAVVAKYQYGINLSISLVMFRYKEQPLFPVSFWLKFDFKINNMYTILCFSMSGISRVLHYCSHYFEWINVFMYG